MIFRSVRVPLTLFASYTPYWYFMVVHVFMCASYEVSSTANCGTTIHNVSDLLSDIMSGSEPRDISLLYASDRKLFNVTSPLGSIRLSQDPPRGSAVYSLALLAEYQPNLSAVFLVCLKMAAEESTELMTSGYREITIQVSENVPVGTILIQDLGAIVGVQDSRYYDVVSGNDAGLFDIDHVTGTIFTLAEVDYEQRRFHHLVVRATDISAVETAVFAVVIINVDDVNEYRPVFPVPVYRRTVFGSQITGSFVTTVRAMDDDAGRFGQLRYRPQLPTSSFVVDRTSGHVWLGNPVVMTSRSADDVIRLGITVVAEDAGGWTDQVRLELTVRPGSTSAQPRFTTDRFEFEVQGSATVGDVIGKLSVTGSQLALFALRRHSQHFAVDKHTGRVVVVRDLHTLSTADSLVRYYRPTSTDNHFDNVPSKSEGRDA